MVHEGLRRANLAPPLMALIQKYPLGMAVPLCNTTSIFGEAASEKKDNTSAMITLPAMCGA